MAGKVNHAMKNEWQRLLIFYDWLACESRTGDMHDGKTGRLGRVENNTVLEEIEKTIDTSILYCMVDV